MGKRYLIHKISSLFILSLFFASSVPLLSQTASTPVAERMKAHVMFLADDALMGRYTGTEGNIKAAGYIADYLKKIGVQPIDGSYMKEFPFAKGLKLTDKNNVSFSVLIERPGVPKEMWKPQTRNWATAEDWMPVRFTDNGSVTGDLVFAGFGITAKDQNYDDYQGIDAKGKVVIVLSDSAEGKSPDSRFEKYADLRYKANNARDHGAVGVIFVKTQSDSANTFYKMGVDRMFGNSGIVAVQANRTKLAMLFPRNQQLYPAEQEIMKTKKPKSFVLPNVSATLTVNLAKDEQPVANVVGVIKGSDPSLADEYIVLGAHYDHLGMGAENSLYKGKEPMVHNGADDNASGVAGILEIASHFAANPPKRSILIVAFNGEEEGLLGSSAFVKNPPLPLTKIDAMLNFDMIGRMKNNTLSVFGTGTSSRFAALVDSLSAIDSLKVSKVKEGYGPSDHASFYKEKIPVLFLFTGLHEDYHKPTDDWDKINYDGMAEVVDFSERFISILADASTKPDFIQIASTAMDTAAPGSSHNYGGVWFGIIPNFEDNPDGFKIGGAQPGSPAQKAGLAEGDIITSFDGKAIKNLYDLTYALRDHKPGDKVIVEGIRGGKPMKFEVTLVKR